ncbi:MAG: hypothetical protein P8Y03_28720, partial [Anaerolineales bacterium]
VPAQSHHTPPNCVSPIIIIGMTSNLNSQVFRPELIPRRGEVIAWVSMLLLLVGWFVLRQTHQVNPAIPIFAIFLLLAASSISLGNWVDRHTYIRLEHQGITFHNGLRHVQLRWDQVERVEVLPSNWGDNIEVFSDSAHFKFRTLHVVNAQGKNLGRMGFEQGEQILQHILEQSGLQASHRQDSGYYYARH